MFQGQTTKTITSDCATQRLTYTTSSTAVHNHFIVQPQAYLFAGIQQELQREAAPTTLRLVCSRSGSSGLYIAELLLYVAKIQFVRLVF